MNKELVFPERKDSQSSGIEIKYIKSRDVLIIWGFYDGFIGIEEAEIKFKDFCDKLGIDLKRERL